MYLHSEKELLQQKMWCINKYIYFFLQSEVTTANIVCVQHIAHISTWMLR